MDWNVLLIQKHQNSTSGHTVSLSSCASALRSNERLNTTSSFPLKCLQISRRVASATSKESSWARAKGRRCWDCRLFYLSGICAAWHCSPGGWADLSTLLGPRRCGASGTVGSLQRHVKICTPCQSLDRVQFVTIKRSLKSLSATFSILIYVFSRTSENGTG